MLVRGNHFFDFFGISCCSKPFFFGWSGDCLPLNPGEPFATVRLQLNHQVAGPCAFWLEASGANCPFTWPLSWGGQWHSREHECSGPGEAMTSQMLKPCKPVADKGSL